ncbi:hypothetical protein ACN9JY_10010 [Aliarcobacter butzleri]|uniref:hypothetical protein n=1 Tax=Aliarcobacter butzleri TaxID=28197 RepID=UPI003B2272FD
MEEAKIKTKIEQALKKLKDRDSILLEYNLNERTISHKLGIYIENIFTGYDVDCEYNRISSSCKILDIFPKKCVNNDDTKAITVYPDIIVHKRGNNDENYIVIEIKKSTNNSPEEIAYDKRKLKEYKSQLGYKFAIFINIATGSDFSSTQNDSIEFI